MIKIRSAAITSILTLIASSSISGLAMSGCRQDPLRDIIKPPPAPVVKAILDNRLISLNVNYCTLASQKQTFKTKIVVVFDRSGSNQDRTSKSGTKTPGTDPDDSRRFDGMLNFIGALTPEQKDLFSFALVNFSDEPLSYQATKYGGIPAAQMDRGLIKYGHSFVNPSDFEKLLKADKNPLNSNKNIPVDDGWTNYLMGLDTVTKIIAADVDNNSKVAKQTGAALEQDAYVVIFVSDGAPIVFATEDPHYNGAALTHFTYRQPWSDMSAPMDLQRAVSSITDFSQYPGVLGVSVNTIYYSAAGVTQDIGTGCVGSLTNSCTPCIANDPSCTPTGLLQRMAQNGNGQFLDYSSGKPIDFTQISLPSMFTTYSLVDSIATNKNVVWEDGKLVKDSDGDGLSDTLEESLGFDPHEKYSQEAGISDGVYYKLCGTRSDCNFSQLIAQKCIPPHVLKLADGSWADSDSDGLNDCEEALLGSDPQKFDSNGDILPDGLEFLRGVPFKNDAPPCWSQDEDFDEVNDCQEIKINSPPTVHNSSVKPFHPYSYQVMNTSVSPTNQCYTIRVDNVTVLSDQDEIEFQVIEQPNLLRSDFVLRKATKKIDGDILNFNAEDFL